MKNPYGLCPKCKEEGISRERRPDGNDMCVNGHVYPSKDAIHEKEIKTCPCCGGDAEISTRHENVGYEAYMESVQLVKTACINCGTSTKELVVKNFSRFTEYNCRDFRDNTELRKSEEKSHKKYIESVKQRTIILWNTRV